LGSDEKVDVVKVVALGWVHGLSPPIDRLSFVCYNENAKRMQRTVRLMSKLTAAPPLIHSAVRRLYETRKEVKAMGSDELKRKLGIDDDGIYRINPETGVVQKQGFFGWKDTDTRVDPETGVIQERGFFGWKDTDTRVDPETGVIQERGFFGWKDTDERIDPETRKYQVRGWFGWKDN